MKNYQKLEIILDKDILEWFHSFGKGYQTRMNATLREYMLSIEPTIDLRERAFFILTNKLFRSIFL
ncbi:hypothetical protein FACS1894172_19970 [Spirochaetia bacterium]|nr:hypothetical protein FACS1894172_19970 [Spirochaetia bacterium]